MLDFGTSELHGDGHEIVLGGGLFASMRMRGATTVALIATARASTPKASPAPSPAEDPLTL